MDLRYLVGSGTYFKQACVPLEIFSPKMLHVYILHSLTPNGQHKQVQHYKLWTKNKQRLFPYTALTDWFL